MSFCYADRPFTLCLHFYLFQHLCGLTRAFAKHRLFEYAVSRIERERRLIKKRSRAFRRFTKRFEPSAKLNSEGTGETKHLSALKMLRNVAGYVPLCRGYVLASGKK